MAMHAIDTEVALKVGVNAAALHYQLQEHYGLREGVIPDALSWRELQELVPYLSHKQIRLSRQKLRAAGLIISKYDSRRMFADHRVKRNNAVSRSFRMSADMVCVYCGDIEGPFEVDHIVPLARGGADAHENMAIACKSCNRSKGDRLISEWINDRQGDS